MGKRTMKNTATSLRGPGGWRLGPRCGRWMLFICGFLWLLTASVAEAAADVRIVNQEVAVLPTDEQKLQWIVVMTVENRGNADEPELVVALPEGAGGFMPVEGWGDYAAIDGGVVEKSGLTAGQRRTLAYTFTVPYEGNRLVVDYPVSYVSEAVQILVPPERLAVEAEDVLPQSDMLDFQGQSFRRFTRLNLHPGEQWTLYFTILGQTAALQPVDKSTHPSGLPVVYHDYRQGVHEAVFNLLFIVVVLLLGFVGVRTSMWRAQAVSRRHAEETLFQQREALFTRLVALEEEKQAGAIDDTAYEQRRKQLEDQLLPLLHLEQGRAKR
ncbi:MAG: hypothetical protein C0P68_006675 [Bacillota bacterium]